MFPVYFSLNVIIFVFIGDIDFGEGVIRKKTTISFLSLVERKYSERNQIKPKPSGKYIHVYRIFVGGYLFAIGAGQDHEFIHLSL